MAKGFSLMNLLNDKSKAENVNNGTNIETRVGNDFKVELINVYDLEPSKDNFYSVDDVADLKDSIELLGIQQNLTVKKIIGSDKYKVIAGHRRRIASIQLAEEGKQQFKLVPCRIETNLDEIREKILLIYTNSTSRQLSDWEKVEQLSQLKSLLKEYKKTHEIPGRVRELLAETLNVSVSQVRRIENINDNLTPEFKEELKQNNINFSAAAELSTISPTDQKAVYEQHQEKGTTTLKDVKKVKEKLESKPEPIAGTQHLTVNAANRLKKVLDQRLSLAEHDRKAELSEITENTEFIRLLNICIETVNKEVFEVMGGNIFKE